VSNLVTDQGADGQKSNNDPKREPMFKGSVNVRASVIGNTLKIDSFEYFDNEPGIERVVLEGSEKHILMSVYFASVASESEGNTIAIRVAKKALDRLTFFSCHRIEDPVVTGHQLSPLNPTLGTAHSISMGVTLFVQGAFSASVQLSPSDLKPVLEDPSPAGEVRFGLYRSALLSHSDIEAYIHLYNLLLMLHRDDQGKLEEFIIKHEPGVVVTVQPKKKPGQKKIIMETTYTRLRNEFAHIRSGVNIATTKEEMVKHLHGLGELTKKAISLVP
jgi:hypothetical protein